MSKGNENRPHNVRSNTNLAHVVTHNRLVMGPLNDIYSCPVSCTAQEKGHGGFVSFINKYPFALLKIWFFFRTTFKETNFIPPPLVPLSLFSWGFPISPWLAWLASNFQQLFCLCSTTAWMSQHVWLRSFKELNESKEDHRVLESVSFRIQKRMEFSLKYSSLGRVGKCAECVHRCLYAALTVHRTS